MEQNNTFQYRARSQDGKLVQGYIEAATAEAAAKDLLESGVYPIEITKSKKNINWKDYLNITLIAPKVSIKDLHLFCRQMYTMVKAGIPITNALKRLAESAKNYTLQKALLGMCESVAGGQSLAVSLYQYPKVFPIILRHIVKVGEDTGRLEQAFLQTGNYLNLEIKTLERLKSIMRYPIIVLFAICIAIVVVNIFVVPSFSNLFKTFNAELPVFTRILIATSNFLINYWWFVVLTILLMLLAIRSFIKTEIGKWYWHRLQVKLPAFGPVLEKILLARFARTMVMILRTGVPITDGVELISNSLGNEYFRRKIMEIKRLMESGESFTGSAKTVNIFPSLALQMFMVGEETGELDKMTSEVAEFYEREVDYEIEKLGDLIEPMLLVFVGILVLFLALGVYLPIWELGSAVEGHR